MLVCFVSAAPRRGAIAVEIAEPAGAAEDLVSLSGFSLLVDEPAAAGDTVNAVLGEMLVEAASAADVVGVGQGYDALVDEPAMADDVAYADFELPAGAVGFLEQLSGYRIKLFGTGNFLLVAGSETVASTRSAMVAGPWPVFVNPGASREANADGIMINL